MERVDGPADFNPRFREWLRKVEPNDFHFHKEALVSMKKNLDRAMVFCLNSKSGELAGLTIQAYKVQRFYYQYSTNQAWSLENYSYLRYIQAYELIQRVHVVAHPSH